ncbi:alpha/beta hydrolase [Rhabdaerophilum calidifontis]|uniref:alpha/beta hydrolase n=1 Tax=Rhabdaerophilum calidifontis TaxID=2604328 RepID=UPI00123BBAA8|nr:alpha/beta hydrolase [Rhabdaerophilum calidifontis]
MPSPFPARPAPTRRMALALGLQTLILPRLARAETPSGASRFTLADRFGTGARPISVHLYRPAAWRAADQVLIVLHGRGRNAAEYRDQWILHAEAGRVLVAVPEFDRDNFPGTAAYNWGGVVDQHGAPRPPQDWAFPIIDRVHDAICARTGATRPHYALYGHSAGAQFTHRFLLLAPASRAEPVIIANAGSYTMPRRDVPFPFGLGGIALSDADLWRALARPAVILLGDRDNDPDHESLPRQPGAAAQGPHRLARGHAFFAAAREAAERLGAPFRWRLVEVPGIAHDNAGMAAAAIRLLAEPAR